MRNDDLFAVAYQRRGQFREDHRYRRNVEFGFLGMAAVVEADREDLARHDRVQQLHLVAAIDTSRPRGERVPRLIARNEPSRSRGSGIVDHPVVFEGADPDLLRWILEADRFHPEASCSSRRTLIALTARGMPAYGVIWRMVSSICSHGTWIARSARMCARTCGSLDPSAARTARMISSRSRASSPGRVWTSPNA